MHKYSILIECNLTPIAHDPVNKTDMSQLKTILKVQKECLFLLYFESPLSSRCCFTKVLKTSLLLHSLMLRGSSFQFVIP